MISFALMRHGEAQDSAPDDCLRELTRNGMESARKLAKTVQHELGREIFKHIVCSPYTRAQQTAKIMAEYFAIDSFTNNDAITPNNHVVHASKSLSSIQTGTLIVCHMPIIGFLSNYLTQGDASIGIPYRLNELVFFETEYFDLGLATRGKHYV